MKKNEPKTSDELKGWAEIAQHLNKPVATVQRWAKEGMPVRRVGRFIVASEAELSRWFGEERGQAVHIVEPGEDLTAELRKSVSAAKKGAREELGD